MFIDLILIARQGGRCAGLAIDDVRRRRCSKKEAIVCAHWMSLPEAVNAGLETEMSKALFRNGAKRLLTTGCNTAFFTIRALWENAHNLVWSSPLRVKLASGMNFCETHVTSWLPAIDKKLCVRVFFRKQNILTI
jgi:hypothetical protein